jgi:hypothetical protein
LWYKILEWKNNRMVAVIKFYFFLFDSNNNKPLKQVSEIWNDDKSHTCQQCKTHRFYMTNMTYLVCTE